MGIIKDNVLMMCKSLEYFKGRTSNQLQTEVDWLKNMSLYGVEFYLVQGERMGYIYFRINKDNDIIYYTKKKGIKEYNTHFGE